MTDPLPSNRPGLGSTPFRGGVTFRVWAPNASQVGVERLVAGAPQATPLAPEGGGVWSGDVPGAAVGDRYHYLVQQIGGADEPRLDPRAAHATAADGDSIVYDHNAFRWDSVDYTAPLPGGLVVYEMHVGSFYRSDTSPIGTLDDAATKLPFLRDLGINAIELMPMAEFAGASSWGYNPALPFAVEELYGGPDALKRFVAAAHGAGLAVLLDVVYNNIGPQDNALWAFDGPVPGSPGGIYFYGPPRDHTPWADTRPDYGRSEVAEYLIDNARAWLDEYRMDGLRFDATAYIRNIDGDGDPSRDIPEAWALLQTINDQLTAAHPAKITIAEDNQSNDWITRPITDDHGAAFDSQWEPGFVWPVRSALAADNDGDRDMNAVVQAIVHGYSSRAAARVIYTESHDADANGGTRLPTQIDPTDPASYWSKKRSTLGAALVFTAPGIPMIFQGQEFLESLWFSDDHFLDWSKAETNAGIVELYRDLIRLRRNWFNTTRGLQGEGTHVYHINEADKVIAFRRWDRGGPCDDVLVVANFADRGYSSYTIGAPRAGMWLVRFNSDWPGYDPSFTGQASNDTSTRQAAVDGQPYCLDLGLGPYTAVLLSQAS